MLEKRCFICHASAIFAKSWGRGEACDMAYVSISPVPTRIPPGSRAFIGTAEPADQLAVDFRYVATLTR